VYKDPEGAGRPMTSDSGHRGAYPLRDTGGHWGTEPLSRQLGWFPMQSRSVAPSGDLGNFPGGEKLLPRRDVSPGRIYLVSSLLLLDLLSPPV
jgi:hypothetical protein